MAKSIRLKNPNDSIFVSRFKEIIGETETQQQIANKIGTTPQNVHNWLKGTIPDSFSLERIARAYNVSVNWLTGISNKQTVDIEEEKTADYLGLSVEAVREIRDYNCFTHSPTTTTILGIEVVDLCREIFSKMIEQRIIQELVQYAADLSRESTNLLNIASIDGKTFHSFTPLDQQCDIKKVRIFEILSRIVNCYDERIKQSEKFKELLREHNQFDPLDSSEWKSDREQKGM